MKKLLVTGGAGFIGSNFIHYILEKYPNYKVVNLDLLTYAGNLENLVDLEKNSNYKFVKGNIADKKLVNELVKDIDVIVNFAAETHVDRSIMDATVFLHTNVLGTHNLLEAAKKNNVRFHHVSTDEVYGDLQPKDKPFNEHSQYNPRNPYSASKAASDHLVLSYWHTHKLPVTITNCSNNYGPYQFPEKFIPLSIINLLQGKTIPIYGDGLQIRDWIHTTDHSRAVELVIHKGKIGEIYCVGGAEEKTNLDLAKMIIKLLGKNEDVIEYIKDRPGHDRRYAIDYRKIKTELGWEPRIDFEQGLKQTVQWYKDSEDWWKHCQSGEYQNYYKEQYK